MGKSITKRIADRYGSKKGLLRYYLHHPFWRRYPWALQPGAAADIRRLVFICQGNICRSALATAVAEQYGLSAVSFGLETRDGKEAAPNMVAAASRFGVDLSDHAATRVDHYVPAEGDLVCLMEPSHRSGFLASCSEPIPRMTLLGLWHPEPSAYIHDPLCCGKGYFEFCTNFLAECVHQIALAAQAEGSDPYPTSEPTENV